MTIECPECKAVLDIGASDPKKALESHYRNFHPDKFFNVKKEPGQSLAELVRNVKSQIRINIPEVKDEPEQPEPGDIQPVGSNAGSDTEDEGWETISDKPELSGETKHESKPFSRKTTYRKK